MKIEPFILGVDVAAKNHVLIAAVVALSGLFASGQEQVQLCVGKAHAHTAVEIGAPILQDSSRAVELHNGKFELVPWDAYAFINYG